MKVKECRGAIRSRDFPGKEVASQGLGGKGTGTGQKLENRDKGVLEQMKKLLTILLIAGVFLIPVGFENPACAGEADVLINFLVKKGVLTQKEATELLQQMRGEVERQEATVRDMARSTAKETVRKEQPGKVKLPKWVDSVTLKGDFRFRYQEENTKNDDNDDRRRERIRLRLGGEAKICKNWKVGFGLATGGNDPRSTNQTLQNAFDTPDIRLDYAYAQYQPWKWIKLIAGKFKNPLWRPKDLLWDGDIRPEGFAASFKYKVVKPVELFATTGFLTLEEFNPDQSDPTLFFLQAGANWKIYKGLYIKVAPTLYSFAKVDHNAFPNSGGGNSRRPDGTWVNDYDSWALDGELGYNGIPGWVPYVAVFGQYVQSNAEDNRYAAWPGHDENKGWLVGVKFGHKKVKRFGQWQVKYNYRWLEADAWPDFLPDSDFRGGATGFKGHEWEFKFGLCKAVTIGLDYYCTKPINVRHGTDVDDTTQHVLQADLVLKW
jgi:hypothetical protein